MGVHLMKVLLATLSIESESRNDNDYDAPYSLGLAYLYSVLESAGHSVRLLFLNNVDQRVSEEAFFRAAEEFSPDVVGFQVFSMTRVSTFAAMEKLHARFPDIKVVLGGVHASIMYSQILEKFRYPVAVLGEGEITFRELLEAFEGKRDISGVAGLAYWDARVRTTASRPLVENLDSLPDPRHEVFFDAELARTVAHIVSSRGCPFDCSFCCLKAISRRRYRTRSIGRVVAEIKRLKTSYPRLKTVQFHDDTFLLDNARVIEFCRLMMKENLGLNFICSARVKPVSADMFGWMKKAGFTKVMFGLETGSEKLLDSIHKRITKADVINLFRTIKPYDFNVTTFLMCGFPGETADTVRETVELVQVTQKISYNIVAGIGKLWVYPGTEVYEVMKKAGAINDDFWLTDAQVPYFTVDHDLPSLVRFEDEMMDSLSYLRIFTRRGFVRHFLKMPLAVAGALLKKRNRRLLFAALAYPIRVHFPDLYRRLFFTYRRFRAWLVERGSPPVPGER